METERVQTISPHSFVVR